MLKTHLTVVVLLVAAASGGCASTNVNATEEKASYEEFCAAMERLHRANLATRAELGDHPTPFEAGRAHGRFIAENRADIDTVMTEPPPELREEIDTVYGNLLEMGDTAPEDVPAVLAADREIAGWVKRECPG